MQIALCQSRLDSGLDLSPFFGESPGSPLGCSLLAGQRESPQKALRGIISCPFLEPSARSWNHFVTNCCQKWTDLVQNDFEITPRRALRGPFSLSSGRPPSVSVRAYIYTYFYIYIFIYVYIYIYIYIYLYIYV